MKTDIDLLKDIQPTGDLGAVSIKAEKLISVKENSCLLYTSPSPRD